MDPTYQGFGVPVPTKNRYRRSSPVKMIGLIIGALVVIIIAVVLLVNSGDKSVALQQRLSARLATMQAIIVEGTENAKDPGLRELNSVISIQTLSDTTTLNSKMGTSGKPTKELASSEADTESFKELEEAALNNRFDSTYRKIIAAKLESTNALISELHDKTSSKSLQAELAKVYEHFKQLQSRLAATSS